MLTSEFSKDNQISERKPIHSEAELQKDLDKGAGLCDENRKYTDAEKVEIEQTIEGIYKRITSGIEPVVNGYSKIIPVVGPPASGKSTFSQELIKDSNMALIDADDIRSSFPMFERVKQEGIDAGDNGEKADNDAYQACANAAVYMGLVLRNKLFEGGYNMAINLQPTGFINFLEKLKAIPEDQADVNVVFISAHEHTLKKSFYSRKEVMGRSLDHGFMERQIGKLPEALYKAASAPFNCELYVRYDHDGAPELLLSAKDNGELIADNPRVPQTSRNAVQFLKSNTSYNPYGGKEYTLKIIMDAYKQACEDKQGKADITIDNHPDEGVGLN